MFQFPQKALRAARAVAVLSMTALPNLAPLAAMAQHSVTAEPAQIRLATVTVAEVERGEVVGRIPISGTLVPRDEVLIYPQVSGYTIDELHVDIGDVVAKGDVLATLNDRTLKAQLAQSQAEYTRAEAGISQARSQIASASANATQAASVLKRAQSLRDSGTATQAVLDQAIANAQTADASLASAQDGLLVANAQLQQAKAQLDIALLNLDHATLRAPVDGLISARNGQLGAIAGTAGEPIFRIVAGGSIEVEAEVIETALGQISEGDRADLEIASIGAVEGAVRLISPTVDPRNRLGKVRISTDAAGMRAGLFASGWIITEEREALTVPASAVLTDLGGTFVLVERDGVLEKRAVVAGLIWNDRREIASGVELAEVVVAKAGAFFADGDRIEPVHAGSVVAEGAAQ